MSKTPRKPGPMSESELRAKAGVGMPDAPPADLAPAITPAPTGSDAAGAPLTDDDKAEAAELSAPDGEGGGTTVVEQTSQTELEPPAAGALDHEADAIDAAMNPEQTAPAAVERYVAGATIGDSDGCDVTVCSVLESLVNELDEAALEVAERADLVQQAIQHEIDVDTARLLGKNSPGDDLIALELGEWTRTATEDQILAWRDEAAPHAAAISEKIRVLEKATRAARSAAETAARRRFELAQRLLLPRALKRARDAAAAAAPR